MSAKTERYLVVIQAIRLSEYLTIWHNLLTSFVQMDREFEIENQKYDGKDFWGV